MRKIVLLFFSLFIFSSFILGQTIIENPKKPLSDNAGRVVKLKEMMRIRDDGVEIIFRAPYDLQIGHDGSIYFYDYWKLHKFTNKGKFVFKIIKQGQGPGEAIRRRTSYLLTKDEIIVQAGSPPKIMRFDLQGNYKDEKRLELTHTFKFLGLIKGKIYGILEEVSLEEYVNEGYIDFPTNLYEISLDFEDINKVYSFPVKHYVYASAAWWPRTRLDYTMKDSQYLFVTHTSTYKIIKFDIEKHFVEKIFKRKYGRVKIPQEKIRKPKPGALSPPPFKFYSDIAKLLIHKGQLWAITSTRDKLNRRLVDVYNMEGKYIDNFYLEFPENIIPRHFDYRFISLVGEYIYSIDEHSDGYFSIAKYKILN